MNRDEMLKLDNQLCFVLYACSREIIRLCRPVLAELGITYTQYVVLMALWEQEVVTLKELGGRLYLDSGTLTPLLKKMEAAGLITRMRCPEDERNIRILLTLQGRDLKHSAYRIPEKILSMTQITPEDVRHLKGQLNQLLQKIEVNSEK